MMRVGFDPMKMKVKNAADYGFLPGANADENSAALNRAVENGGAVEVALPGVYDISEPVYLGSDTDLSFAPGVTLRRTPCKNGDNGNAFVNRGAFTGVPDRNISIRGLTLLVNGVESMHAEQGGTKTVIGLRGHVAFLYVENLTLTGITIPDLGKIDYAISVCEFLHTLVENPANPVNDGKQTPMRGHPVFKAMHATACCCRGCLNKWYRVPLGIPLSADLQTRIVNFLIAWIERQTADGNRNKKEKSE